MTIICLTRGHYGELQIRPRWPSSTVMISPAALDKLQITQANLPNEISLIVTRGYEPHASKLGYLRKFSRIVGIGLFKFFYVNRFDEIEDIFGANGHDQDGTHIDVSLSINGNRIRLLPLSVFTPLFWQNRRVEKYRPLVDTVKSTLIENGFRIHRNKTESHQIHCDLITADKVVS